MSGYISFTEEEKTRAYEADIVDLLERMGETVNRVGREYEWFDNKDQKVTISNYLWFNQYERVGGNAVDFVRKYLGLNYPDAIRYILGEDTGQARTIARKHPENRERKVVIPDSYKNMNRVFSYLMKQRGLDRELLHTFASAGLIYESEPYHNAVFVGKDEEGIIRHCHKRGTASQNVYKRNSPGSDPRWSFHWTGSSSSLFLFEAPIDMLSYIQMYPNDWKDNTYAAACSVSDKVLEQCLKVNPQIHNVYVCFDNDKAGQDAAKRIKEKYFTQGVHVEILVPTHKDWNEDLLDSMQHNESEVSTICLQT